jgi:hypothetical protein
VHLVETRRQTAAWIALALNGVGILVFGLIVLALPTPDPDLGYYRAIGAASVGMGVFGLLIALLPVACAPPVRGPSGSAPALYVANGLDGTVTRLDTVRGRALGPPLPAGPASAS